MSYVAKLGELGYTLEPVVIEGQLAVLNDDPYGLYYRVEDGNAVN